VRDLVQLEVEVAQDLGLLAQLGLELLHMGYIIYVNINQNFDLNY
jgi:hypothetical protein